MSDQKLSVEQAKIRRREIIKELAHLNNLSAAVLDIAGKDKVGIRIIKLKEEIEECRKILDIKPVDPLEHYKVLSKKYYEMNEKYKEEITQLKSKIKYLEY